MAYSNLYLYTNYNNYYNRIHKSSAPLLSRADIFRTNISFAYGDGVNSRQVINLNEFERELQFNYLVCENQETGSLSNWFVIQQDYNRNGQCTLTLRRDLIRDNYEAIMNADSIVHRGIVEDSDLTIFNPEPGSYNQIKVKEDLIQDKTRCPWYVIYIKGNVVSVSQTINTNQILRSKPKSKYKPGIMYYFYEINDNEYAFKFRDKYNSYMMIFNKKGFYNIFEIINDDTLPLIDSKFNVKTDRNLIYKTVKEHAIPQLEIEIKTQFKDENSYFGLNRYNETKSIEPNVYRDTSKLVELKIDNSGTSTTNFKTPVNLNIDIFDKPVNITGEIEFALFSYSYHTIYDTSQIIEGDKPFIQIAMSRLTPVPEGYSILAIPYTEIDTGKIKLGKGVVNEVISILSQKAEVMDIQLLPFSPSSSDELIDVYSIGNIAIYHNVISDERSYIPCVILTDNTVSKYIDYYPSPDYQGIYEPSDVKSNSSLVIKRLCSPNFDSIYEYNDAEIGYPQGFNVDMKLSPVSPFIHIAPDFGGLMNKDFNDLRGLTMSGNFSITQSSNAWEEFKLNNKNYQAIFDNQIETNRINTFASAIPGVLNGIVGGAVQGATIGALGGPVGAGIGAITGGIASGIDTAFGIGMNEFNINQRTKAFNLELGNIKARPNTITKLTNINNVYKYFPVLETYTCETKALENFVKGIVYNGMTVERMGKLKDYAKIYGYAYNFVNPDDNMPFVSGEILRFNDNVPGDSHYLNEINKEVSKGFYVEGGY